jgi:hypothetical protein
LYCEEYIYDFLLGEFDQLCGVRGNISFQLAEININKTGQFDEKINIPEGLTKLFRFAFEWRVSGAILKIVYNKSNK